MEGEGYFHSRKASGMMDLQASQVQKWPLDRMQALFGGTIYKNPKVTFYHWRLPGVVGAGLAMTLYPLMSPRRQEQIRFALTRWKSHKARVSKKYLAA
jgi:hypothetical protein